MARALGWGPLQILSCTKRTTGSIKQSMSLWLLSGWFRILCPLQRDNALEEENDAQRKAYNVRLRVLQDEQLEDMKRKIIGER